MKRSVKVGIGLALLVAASFAAGMWFMYWAVMWSDVLVKFIEMSEKVFK